MLRRVDLRGASGDLRTLLPRPLLAGARPVDAVCSIMDAVRDGGDGAVLDLTGQHDGVRPEKLVVSRQRLEAALDALSPGLRRALDAARAAVEEHHLSNLPPREAMRERNGVVVRALRLPVARAGAYVPSGLLSSAVMTVVPALCAGVAEVVVCTPPGPSGAGDPNVLAATLLAGATKVFVANGPAGIAAMAYGTESVAAVDVIVGPGNAYVAQAKREAAARGLVGVPSSFAGPSEVAVIADDSAPTEYAAIDLIVQAEHGPEGLAWLIVWSEDVAERVEAMVEKLVAGVATREVVTANLEVNGYIAIVDGPEQAIDVANAIAPEHLELMVADPEALLRRVKHAGAVFCGPWAPASLGDYLAGPSHVLPTSGSARYAGALGTADFMKTIHVITANEQALASLAPHIEALATAEGMDAHAESVRLRGQS